MLFNKVLILVIQSIRQFLGVTGCCRFELSCTDYAIFELTHSKLIPAIKNILNRVIQCQPLYKLK